MNAKTKHQKENEERCYNVRTERLNICL